MILKPYASSLMGDASLDAEFGPGNAFDQADDSGSSSDSGSSVTGILNSTSVSNAVSGVLSLFGAKTGTTTGRVSFGTGSQTSPWVYLGGGVLAIGALALLFRRKAA